MTCCFVPSDDYDAGCCGYRLILQSLDPSSGISRLFSTLLRDSPYVNSSWQGSAMDESKGVWKDKDKVA